MIVNSQSGTRIDEIADRIYRISTPVPPSQADGGFSFNQYLVVDEAPLLFHTGMRSLYAFVRQAIETVMPLEELRYIGISHVEADECGALNELLAAAPRALPVCSRVAAAISLGDLAARPARGLGDGETLSLGARHLIWLDAPHVPHNWETGYFFEPASATLLCGDLFTHGGHDRPPLTSEDILERADAFRDAEPQSGLPPSHSLGPTTAPVLRRLARLQPRTLACMHGSAWQGSPREAAAMLERLADRLAGEAASQTAEPACLAVLSEA